MPYEEHDLTAPDGTKLKTYLMLTQEKRVGEQVRPACARTAPVPIRRCAAAASCASGLSSRARPFPPSSSTSSARPSSTSTPTPVTWATACVRPSLPLSVWQAAVCVCLGLTALRCPLPRPSSRRQGLRAQPQDELPDALVPRLRPERGHAEREGHQGPSRRLEFAPRLHPPLTFVQRPLAASPFRATRRPPSTSSPTTRSSARGPSSSSANRSAAPSPSTSRPRTPRSRRRSSSRTRSRASPSSSHRSRRRSRPSRGCCTRSGTAARSLRSCRPTCRSCSCRAARTRLSRPSTWTRCVPRPLGSRTSFALLGD